MHRLLWNNALPAQVHTGPPSVCQQASGAENVFPLSTVMSLIMGSRHEDAADVYLSGADNGQWGVGLMRQSCAPALNSLEAQFPAQLLPKMTPLYHSSRFLVQFRTPDRVSTQDLVPCRWQVDVWHFS